MEIALRVCNIYPRLKFWLGSKLVDFVYIYRLIAMKH